MATVGGPRNPARLRPRQLYVARQQVGSVFRRAVEQPRFRYEFNDYADFADKRRLRENDSIDESVFPFDRGSIITPITNTRVHPKFRVIDRIIPLVEFAEHEADFSREVFPTVYAFTTRL